MKHVTKRINERITAYQYPGQIRIPLIPGVSFKDRDFQVSMRLHHYLRVKLDFLAVNAQMTRSRLILEMLQDVAEDITDAMDPELKQKMDQEINKILQSQD